MSVKKEKWFRILKLPCLIIFYILFLLLGAYIINRTEADFDENIRNERRVNLLKVLHKHNFSRTDPRIKEILIAAQKALDVDAVKLKRLDRNLTTRWTFSSSLFFTATLVTTVGEFRILHDFLTSHLQNCRKKQCDGVYFCVFSVAY